MELYYDVLIVEDNYAERSNILQRFKENQLKHKIIFLHNCNEALTELYFFNKEISSGCLPKIILLDYQQCNIDFLEKIKSDIRYDRIKIYFLISSDTEVEIEKLSQYKIGGFIEKNFDFKNFSNKNYIATLDLFLELLKIGIEKNNQRIS